MPTVADYAPICITSQATATRPTSQTTGGSRRDGVASPLAEAGILVYEQGEGASANTLLETFREADKAVLLGTRAFWEGVDIPGDALSVLVIAPMMAIR